ncbi:MAG: SGNH/GDSL hydrolase family protein [Prolixibacteraceae bacterium]|nr:SGNH/GDSL hydrolase family protein [Prolixibacteraceae bacterium]
MLLNHFTTRNKKLFTAISLLGVAILTYLFTGCQQPQSKTIWVGTWNTAPQLVEPHNMPPEPGLTNNTLRQWLRVSIGSDSLRVRFSNEFSTSPVTLKALQIAASAGGSAIDPATAKELKFNNNTGVTMQPGTAIASDPVAFDLKPRMDVAITIAFGETSPDVTGHPGSRTTSYIMKGSHLSDVDFEGATKTDHWYVINGIDVRTPENAAAVTILGNSITDGRGSGTNKQNRWPDILSEKLLENPATKNVAVLNQGIGGNCVLRQCLGSSALNRFERDVLKQHGVKWLIIYEGINDLGQTPDSASAIQIANDLIAAYNTMIDKAHANNINVYGATLMPFGKSFYYTDFRETSRKAVNEWIRTSGRFDAVIDFDKTMQNPDDPLCMSEGSHDGDYLHPSEEGHRIMGESVDLSLFESN